MTQEQHAQTVRLNGMEYRDFPQEERPDKRGNPDQPIQLGIACYPKIMAERDGSTVADIVTRRVLAGEPLADALKEELGLDLLDPYEYVRPGDVIRKRLGTDVKMLPARLDQDIRLLYRDTRLRNMCPREALRYLEYYWDQIQDMLRSAGATDLELRESLPLVYELCKLFEGICEEGKVEDKMLLEYGSGPREGALTFKLRCARDFLWGEAFRASSPDFEIKSLLKDSPTDTIDEKQQEILKLNEELKALRASNIELAAELAGITDEDGVAAANGSSADYWQEQCAELQTKLAASQTLVQAAEDLLSEAEGKHAVSVERLELELTNFRKDTERKIASLEDDLKAAQATEPRSASQEYDLAVVCVELREELQHSKDRIRETGAALAEKCNDYDILNKHFDQSIQDRDALGATCNRLREKLDEVTAERDAAVKSLEDVPRMESSSEEDLLRVELGQQLAVILHLQAQLDLAFEQRNPRAENSVLSLLAQLQSVSEMLRDAYTLQMYTVQSRDSFKSELKDLRADYREQVAVRESMAKDIIQQAETAQMLQSALEASVTDARSLRELARVQESRLNDLTCALVGREYDGSSYAEALELVTPKF